MTTSGDASSSLWGSTSSFSSGCPIRKIGVELTWKTELQNRRMLLVLVLQELGLNQNKQKPNSLWLCPPVLFWARMILAYFACEDRSGKHWTARLRFCLSVCLYPDSPSEEVTIASSILVLHWQLMHQWKCLHENCNTENEKCEEKKSRKVRILTCDEELKSP